MTADLFAGYDRRFRRALDTAPERRPWVDDERMSILAAARRCLGLDPQLVPSLEVRTGQVGETAGEAWTTEHLQATSWPGVWCAADLYLPQVNGPAPAVILACGHADGAKRAPAYRALAGLLARQGVAVLVSDNLGQGERAAMGHQEVPGVFACDLSLQGLIVMETMAWLRWLRADPRIDRARIGLVGNSGGGLLSLLAGALCRDDLAVVSSSGFPSRFTFVARKEKQLCHCTLLPGIVGELEMWQLYGSIAPTPLLLFQGRDDHFFPEDLFWETARRTFTAFDRAGAAGRFAAEVLPGGHGWDARRRRLLARFVCAHLGVLWQETVTDPPQPPLPACLPAWPRAALTTEQLARRLSGCDREAADLADVFPSDVPSEPVPLLRGDPRLIAAQYEAFLRDGLAVSLR
ncbi:alpha/beta hydrolase family protein [Jiangella anatolica]|uniref:Acetyl xylan esterase domain-containing protein n=1 Tax=Jiangella anatolica TaxID=2670374 RepID=A0A2W2BD90_9ACTN|nr:acetylxylan esterase [Jiangella anatolica]PZF85601.1 hypothetical protein C1I92_04340 [Jiangella anatolica]